MKDGLPSIRITALTFIMDVAGGPTRASMIRRNRATRDIGELAERQDEHSRSLVRYLGTRL